MLRLAATVMLLRQSERMPLQAFMLRRSAASHFVPEAYVFPGGTLEASDTSPQSIERLRFEDAWLSEQFRARVDERIPVPQAVLSERERCGLLVAALRELFEEAGVLLACDARGARIEGPRLAALSERLQSARGELQRGELRFDELLREMDLHADASALVRFSEWITPPVYPRRYDAHFFVAMASPDQAASADRFETHDGVWIEPERALALSAEGAFNLVFPTIKHLERLAAFNDAASLLAFAREKPIVRVMPLSQPEHRFALPPDLENAW